ncbi:MAG TPA: hypothetical protein DCL42_08090 [Deltaproteobacteria bacterium]|nr:MAG: hypothetical protein A2067_07910 [Deltaproteobacteria bacterium GWB2_42_7]OGP42378.1 MAG: hypothetical protein A2090_09275 [Deltaproteobacteria bacterium GWD2_42_10]OGP46967.1 MAG: hypothetical protein A2022_02670 [Deltaproteobacteria bacterium GWF2_42_12]OGQ28586.1 MAG: hypothetical protein A3D29_04180 [Deltaproteobacteria bacterium RIFCSPHIGHO2_02_FULL_42_44]OGQ70277.1 MAG: hypothetical protein A3F88_05015 [Deltaproteobacteria bacterium RIFCSPLOWO2_12_FULL_42_16]OGQ72838.1 MAG: hypot
MQGGASPRQIQSGGGILFSMLSAETEATRKERFSVQTQDLSQRQGKTGWTRRSMLFPVCEYLDR